METLIITLNILATLSVIGIHLILRNYLPGYMNKKGENLATKEDIGGITKKIEEVKLEFADRSHGLIKKRENYEEICAGMQVFIAGHSTSPKEKDRMLRAYSLAWLWASDEVLQKLNHHLSLQLMKSQNPKSVEQEGLKVSYTECILEMRRDSGYKETKQKEEDFQFISF